MSTAVNELARSSGQLCSRRETRVWRLTSDKSPASTRPYRGNGWLPEIMSLCGSFSSDELFRTTRPAAIVSFNAATNGGQGEGFNISVWTEVKGQCLAVGTLI
ncbi:hypothetical protein PoB_007188700 [Plakobranchus ocellatus]|uniref:Uncharacterized protein n=1 Tax=Plakobranchus ocellatus TaxID=259542 RepID=A0AAV4DMP5_9GAST|nr:hypothetical protein PoB_007188700 [Plakobranchus ocellatus]